MPPKGRPTESATEGGLARVWITANVGDAADESKNLGIKSETHTMVWSALALLSRNPTGDIDRGHFDENTVPLRSQDLNHRCQGNKLELLTSTHTKPQF
jgi:hypothetical protein